MVSVKPWLLVVALVACVAVLLVGKDRVLRIAPSPPVSEDAAGVEHLRSPHSTEPRSAVAETEPAASVSAGTTVDAGRVTFLSAADGAPVEDVAWIAEAPGGASERLRSDGYGAVRLPRGAWLIRPAEEGYALLGELGEASVRVEPGCERVIWVARRCDVAVRILSSTGEPLEGASISWAVDDSTGETKLLGHAAVEERRVASDARGRAVLPGVPIPWATRLLVSHPSHHPFQGSLPNECGGGIRTVTLRAEEAGAGGLLTVFDEKGRPLPGVDVYADIVDEDWMDARPALLGTSDEQGTLTVARWAREVNGLVFRGASYPSRIRLEQTGGWREPMAVTLSRPATGRIVLENGEPGAEYLMEIGDEGEDRARALAHDERIRADSETGLAATLPAGRPVNVSLTSRDGAWRWSGSIFVEAEGWEQRATLRSVAESLTLLTEGDTIEAFRARGTAWIAADPFRVDGGVRLPVSSRGLDLLTASGLRGHLWNRCSTDEDRMLLSLPHLVQVQLLLVDEGGRRVRDLEVHLSTALEPRDRMKLRQDAGCWSWWPHYDFSALPEADGRVTFMAPPGRYEVEFTQLPWRETFLFGSVTVPDESRMVVAREGAGVQRIAVPRPRLLEVEWEAGSGEVPSRWSLWDVRRERGQVFFGRTARVWITSESARIEVRSGEGETLTAFTVPAGSERWRQAITP